MPITFEPIQTEEEITRLATMADEIWHEYWPALIGKPQTDYMVEQLQSLEAIRRDMQERGYEYWFICDSEEAVAEAETETESEARTKAKTDIEAKAETEVEASDASLLQHADFPPLTPRRIVGYTGGHVEPETNRFFISKIYLFASERGKGFASATIRFYEHLCHERGLCAMYLTVNKHNDLGIRAYKAKGFTTIESVETNIGNGFVMDDYIMEKQMESESIA